MALANPGAEVRLERLLPIGVGHLDEPDIEDDQFPTLDALGKEIEFYDELSPERLQFRGADGSALRVVAYALEVVLLRIVHVRITIHQLRLSRCIRSDDGCLGEAEICEDQVHRVRWSDGSIAPLHPLDDVEDVRLIAGATPSVEDFIRDWPDARLRYLRRARQDWVT